MAYPPNVPVAVPSGPVQYKRQYSLALLVILILFCWPAAIIYYFTREKVAVQEFAPGQVVMVATPAATGYAAPAPGVAGAPPSCSRCGRPTTFMPQYSRYYCYSCSQYV
ncbi:MAG: hypothetical protein KGI98_03565 [Euryarchaeota archaeon]|nr:hypothetical protein [Euryarchaeota archaeon]MDE1880203.1 hypothetical protein [Euryarchaeota archaeon]